MKPERKAFAFKLDAPPDDEGRFGGYAAVFGNVDRQGDVIDPGAFTKTLQERADVPILWSHKRDEPIGVSTALGEDGKGLRIEGQLALETQRGREVHALLRLGAVKGLSIGYTPVKRTFKGAVRHLQEIALGEVSPCVFPANVLALVDDVKDLHGYATTESVECLLGMIRRGADFVVEEVRQGDAADAGRMQAILTSLSKLLASELSELALDDEQPDPALPVEMMRAPIEGAIKSLTALLETAEPADATRDDDGAADAAEPELASTLAAIARDITSRAP